ncbi:MAG: hypothetical protein RI959_1802, partial [Pseudomonadota bacterium]
MKWGTWPLLLLAGWGQALALAWPFGAFGFLQRGEPSALLQGLSLVFLLLVLRRAPSARAAAGRAWVFATAWLAGTFGWLFVSMHVYGGLPAVLAVLAVLALAAFLGSYYALMSGLFWRWRLQAAWVQALAFGALWSLAEWARGTWFTGFPWGAGGYALLDSQAWLAPWVGVYGMGALSAALAAGVVASVPGRGQNWAQRWPAALAFGMLAGLCWMPWLNAVLQPGNDHLTRSTGRFEVALLQGNIAQDEKFQLGTGVQQALDWYRAAIEESVSAAQAPDLVVAPETAVPLLPQDLDPDYWSGLLGTIQSGGSAVMLGLPLGNWDDGFTNSVATWTPGALDMQRYDKHHLVPFGEFIPPLFRWFTNLMNIPLGDFNRGAAVQQPLAWAGQRWAPNICYEDLFGEELAASFVSGSAPTVLVNLSNIAWFGDSVAIDQHRHISRLRSLELQRPMLRATNTGATAVIDHRGHVTDELPRLSRGVLRAS